MALLTLIQMDMALLIFVVISLLKYIILKDKDSKVFNWLIIGGLFLLIDSAFITINWEFITFTDITLYNSIVAFVFRTIAFILMIIGSIKLGLELFK